MTDGLPSNYDAWRLASPYDEQNCSCDKCEKKLYDETELTETTEGDYRCESCSSDYESCSSCGVVIISSDYGHDELCDSCVDRAVDKAESNKGETY